MTLAEASAQEIPGEPAPVVLKPGLIFQVGAAEDAAEIFGLNQLGLRVDLPNGLHGENDAAALMDQRAGEGAGVPPMGIPETVETGESCRREGLVDGRVRAHPGVTFGHAPREAGELLREAFVQQARVRRAAAVVEKTNDGAYAQLP